MTPESVVAALAERCSFASAGTAVTCAVSGGPDSSALLALATRAGCSVTAVYVDHRLRPDSALDAVRVRELAERFGAAFRCVVAPISGTSNVEARARDARLAALGPDALTGHTADDLAETVLMFLLRGTGPDGLAGFDVTRRPLCRLRRSDTRALCDALGIDPVIDPMNDDPRFVRSRLRHEAVPLLNDIAGRDIVPLLCRTATLQGDLLTALDEVSVALDPTDGAALTAAPRAVAAASLRRWWRAESGSAYAPPAAAIDRMLDVAAGRCVRAEVVSGWRVARTHGVLRLEAP